MFLCLCAPFLAKAEPVIFIPSEITFTQSDPGFNYFEVSTLNNQQLVERASQLRDRSLTAPQRAMNYQWLSEHSGNEDAIHGSRAISKLLQRSLKAQWERQRNTDDDNFRLIEGKSQNRFMPDLEYDVKVSSHKFSVGVVYEF